MAMWITLSIVIFDVIIKSISRPLDASCSKTEIPLTHNERLQSEFSGTSTTVQIFNLFEVVIDRQSF